MGKRGRPPKVRPEEQKTIENVKDAIKETVNEVKPLKYDNEIIDKLTKQIIAKTEVRSLGNMTTAQEKRMIKAIVEIIVEYIR